MDSSNTSDNLLLNNGETYLCSVLFFVGDGFACSGLKNFMAIICQVIVLRLWLPIYLLITLAQGNVRLMKDTKLKPGGVFFYISVEQ